jgi:hypothetical protein
MVDKEAAVPNLSHAAIRKDFIAFILLFEDWIAFIFLLKDQIAFYISIQVLAAII